MHSRQPTSGACEIDDVETDLLRAELERALTETWHACPRIAHLERQASPYRTSFALEELQVSLKDGRHLRIMWKDLHRRSLDATARRAKPGFLHNPAREIETYRQVLAPHHLSTATFYGAVIRPMKPRYWLFLEHVAGCELYQVGDFEVWHQAARWLAGMHVQFRGRASRLRGSAPLLVQDRAFYHRWIMRARQFAVGTESAAKVEWLARRHDRVIDRLLALPTTLLHGEFYASNVLVDRGSDSPRVCPVDWELAAIGPGLMDLGALVAGSWSEEEKRELACAYYLALSPRQGTFEELLEALDYCRLQIAVQWLGWSTDWSPPPEHAHDWLREAISLAGKLEL